LGPWSAYGAALKASTIIDEDLNKRPSASLHQGLLENDALVHARARRANKTKGFRKEFQRRNITEDLVQINDPGDSLSQLVHKLNNAISDAWTSLAQHSLSIHSHLQTHIDDFLTMPNKLHFANPLIQMHMKERSSLKMGLNPKKIKYVLEI
jgi:hypothetical protein